MYGMEQMDDSAMTQINGESLNFASIDGPKKPKNVQKVSENNATKSLLTDEPLLESWKLHDMELDSEPETSSSDMNDADVLDLGASDDEDLLLEKDEFIAPASSKISKWSSQTANKAKAIENNETSQEKKPIVLKKPLVKSSVRTPITFNGGAAAKPTPVRNPLLPRVFGAKPGPQIPKMGAEQRISIGPQVLKPVLGPQVSKPVLGPQVSKAIAVPRTQKPVAGPLMSKSVTGAQLSEAFQAISNWKIPVGTNVKVIQRTDNDSERPMEWENLKISIPCSAGSQLKKRKILSDTVQTPVTASLSETFENNGQQNASSKPPAKMAKLANGPVPAIQCIPQIDRNRNLMNQKSSGMRTPSHGIRTIPATITSESGGPISQPPRQLLTIENGVVSPGSSSWNEPQRSVQPNNSLPETDLRHMIGQTSVKRTSGSTPSLSRAENAAPDLRTKISKSRSVPVVPIEVADEELDYDYSGMVSLEDDTDLANGPIDRKTTPVLQIEGQSLVNGRDPTPSDDEVSGYPSIDVQVNNPALPEQPPAESPSDDMFMGWQNETANVLPKHNPPKLVDRDPRKISSQLLKDFRDNTQPTTKLPESSGLSSQQISRHTQENNVKSSRTPQQRTPRIQKVVRLPSNYIDIPLKPPRNDKIRYAPYIETPTVQRYGINVIFPHLCLKFVRGKCFTKLAQCPLRHTFPEADVIRKSLDDLLSTDVANIYRTYLIHCPNLLRPYFAEFCDYFGSHGMANMLIEMIHQCETNVLNMPNNLGSVHQGFMKSGKKYSAALDSIIKSLRRKSTLHHALLKLILDERNDNYGYFFDTIFVLVEMDDVALDANDIDRLCVICKQYNNKPLYDAIFAIITKCQLDPTYVAVDSLNIEILTEFLEETSRKFLKL